MVFKLLSALLVFCIHVRWKFMCYAAYVPINAKVQQAQPSLSTSSDLFKPDVLIVHNCLT